MDGSPDLSSPPAAPGPIRVLVAADVTLYREGLSQSLALRPSLQVVGTAATAEQAVERMAALRPGVVLLDLGMEGSGRVVQAAEASAPRARVVALAVREVEADVVACAAAGVTGYVPRDGSMDDLVAAVEAAACGELRVSPRMAATLFQRLATLSTRETSDEASLTRRESEIVGLIGQGMTNKEISRRLHIELSTVKNHVHNILEKLRVTGRGAAVARLRDRTLAGRGASDRG